MHEGTLTDTAMHVLDAENRSVPGLYAGANVAGGLYGADYPLLRNGNSPSRAITWARASAADLAGQK